MTAAQPTHEESHRSPPTSTSSHSETTRQRYIRSLPVIFRSSTERPTNTPQRARDENRTPKIHFRSRAPQTLTKSRLSFVQMHTTGGDR